MNKKFRKTYHIIGTILVGICMMIWMITGSRYYFDRMMLLLILMIFEMNIFRDKKSTGVDKNE